MNLESTQKELEAAYKKLEETESRLVRAQNALSKRYKVEKILVAGGFVSQDKINEARDLLECVE